MKIRLLVMKEVMFRIVLPPIGALDISFSYYR